MAAISVKPSARRYSRDPGIIRIYTQLAFCVNLHRAVIGPSATLTGRWRPDIDLRRMLTGYFVAEDWSQSTKPSDFSSVQYSQSMAAIPVKPSARRYSRALCWAWLFMRLQTVSYLSVHTADAELSDYVTNNYSKHINYKPNGPCQAKRCLRPWSKCTHSDLYRLQSSKCVRMRLCACVG